MKSTVSPQLHLILETFRVLDQQNDLRITVMAVWESEKGIVLFIDPLRWAQYAFLTVSSLMALGFTYTPFNRFFEIDGQPRVSYTGNVWLTVGGIINDLEVILHIISDLGSHALAENELLRFYSLIKERLGMEPIDLFRKMLKPSL